MVKGHRHHRRRLSRCNQRRHPTTTCNRTRTTATPNKRNDSFSICATSKSKAIVCSRARQMSVRYALRSTLAFNKLWVHSLWRHFIATPAVSLIFYATSALRNSLRNPPIKLNAETGSRKKRRSPTCWLCRKWRQWAPTRVHFELDI